MRLNVKVLSSFRSLSSMAERINPDLYEAAVLKLNKLQSNVQVLAEIRRNNKMYEINVQESLGFLRYLNVSVDDIDKLNCIHVTGTKGKGSTCAFVESILKDMGFKTGFYSSPHLINVCERIRINGHPLSKDEFAKYFFEIYNTLDQNKSADESMPPYFKYLTLMAFKVFHDKNVDVAIIEVGIGGENDCTNIIRKPVVSGITTLDYDHVNLLGTTLADIAWQKSGIMKPDSVLISVEQPPEVLDVLKRRSVERNCPLFIIPDILRYGWPNGSLPKFGIAGEHQYLNISLALQLTRFWLLRTKNLETSATWDSKSTNSAGSNDLRHLKFDERNGLAFTVPLGFVKSLENCFWPGRTQVLKKDSVTYYLDSAHTPQSIMCCANWFCTLTKSLQDIRVLIFYCTGDRDPEILMKPLKECNFDMVLFCPTRLKHTVSDSGDTTSMSYSDSEEVNKCKRNEGIWHRLTNKTNNTAIFACIADALKEVNALAASNPADELQVLVTGSLHLVGGILYFVQPEVFDR